MLHFNLDCPQRVDALSVASCASLDEFVALARANPDNYCTACARTDSDRYAELRKLAEAVQIDSKFGTARAALDALLDWRHQ